MAKSSPGRICPAAGGLSLQEVRDALRVFVGQPNLAALVVAGYNPDLDTDGQGARKLIDLLADALSARLEVLSSAAAAGAADAASDVTSAKPKHDNASSSESLNEAEPDSTTS